MSSITRDSVKDFFKKVTKPVWLISIGAMFAAFGVYWVINHLIVPEYLIHCRMDDYIPFIADFALVYVYWFAYLPIGMCQMLWHRDFGGAKGKLDFKRYMLLYFISWGICLVCYVVFPNAIDFRPSPEEIGYETFCTGGLALTYQGFDLPANVLPSLHCISTIATCVGILSSDFCKRSQFKSLYRAYYLLFTVLICAATVFVKQHSIIDFFASAGIIAVLYPLIYLVDWKKLRKQCSVETA